MARYIIIYDERTIFFEGSLKALRDFLDKIRKATPQGCKPPIWAQVTKRR